MFMYRITLAALLSMAVLFVPGSQSPVTPGAPIRTKTRHSLPADMRKMRPWLWPSSPIMKEMWKAIGAVPVPLGMGEVFGAVQTRMVDLVESTAIAFIALQWHTTDLAYVTEETSGVLIGAWLI